MRVILVLAPNAGVRELEGTNTWIVGEAPAIVIDPGPNHAGHLHEVARTAGMVGAIAITHDHPDHAPGALPLAEVTGAAVYSARPVEGMERIRDGDLVSAGPTTLSVVAAPGHTPDHLTFHEMRSGSLFTGYAVLGRGTSVIDPPEGDLPAYLRTLRRLRELSPRTIYPGHGPVVLRAVAKLDEYLEHRAMREEQVAEIYADHPPEVHELAARSVLAHLLKLEVEGSADKRPKAGVVRWSKIEPRSCERCGRPVRGRVRLCGSCTVAVLQE